MHREQQFSNLLTLKDYRNAIALALRSEQPRRLLNLFTTVNANRPDGQGSQAAGRLLQSALEANEAPVASSADSTFQALKAAGIFAANSSASRHANRKGELDTQAESLDSDSITGSTAVDHVIAQLPQRLLRQLLLYVRDWNTTARTAPVAQIVLHAILRAYSAEQIISAFQQPRKTDDSTATREEEEEAEEQEVQAAKSKRSKGAKAGARRPRPERRVDLNAVIDALLPYTERHYARADRMLTESAVLSYTLAAMDSVLGLDFEEDEQEMLLEQGETMDVDDEDMLLGQNGHEETEEGEEELSDEEEPDFDE